MSELLFDPHPIAVAPSLLGESPFWHPDEKALYWCDIPGRKLNRFEPARAVHQSWSFDCEPASCAPMIGGDLLLAMRDGLWRFSPASGHRKLLAPPPYNPEIERFNDGKADPQGRFWVGTIYEPRDQPAASLYCWSGAQLRRVAGGVTVSNGLAWSPDGRTLYWGDTKAHRIDSVQMNVQDGALSLRQLWVQFAQKQPEMPLSTYGGRPDGAAVDTQGCYWSAQFEGQRLLRISPQGQVLQVVALPVRCPTMPCFGDDDLRTLYITTGRENRSAAELAAQPLAGSVFRMRVEVPGLPVNFAAD